MLFDEKHRPRAFSDLVFADPNIAAVVESYMGTPPAKPLLLAGPPGSGKTEAARVIAETYFAHHDMQSYDWEMNGSTVGASVQDRIMAEVNFQVIGSADRALVVINEIDELDRRKVQPAFRDFMDDKKHLVRIIATTNYKAKLMGALLSRFRVLDMIPPSKMDWVTRAKAILEAEGLTPSRADVVTMLQSFQGDARDLIDYLEEVVIASRPSVAASR